MSQDRSSLEAVVQSYFDGLYEGDTEKLGAIFHPSADLRWVEKGELQVLTVPDWLHRVRKRPSGKAEAKPREDFIVTIDRSDDKTAFIKVRCQLPPRFFTDYLVAMKLADGWQIVSKSFRYALRGGGAPLPLATACSVSPKSSPCFSTAVRCSPRCAGLPPP